jgi:pyruvate,water dikinase
MVENQKYILWFNEIGMEDLPRVGGKNASLGEMYCELSPKGIKIPNGFATTSNAYWHFVESAGILEKLKETLAGLDKSKKGLSERGSKARELILNARIPDDLWREIKAAYDRLGEQYGPAPDVAVRSSATAEDLPTASFAGQMESFLNVRGYDELKEACVKCYASLFTDRAISYRIDHHFDLIKIALSIGVMKMVRSDLASSGVMFTLDTETG